MVGPLSPAGLLFLGESKILEPSARIALHISTRQWIDIDLIRLESSLPFVLSTLGQFEGSKQAMWTRPIGWELRLLLEKVCCNLCRFSHAESLKLDPGAIEVDQEYRLSKKHH